jgi:transposase-like protein
MVPIMDESKLNRRVRRSFTDEFKAGVVRLVLDEGKSQSQVARDLDLSQTTIGLWVKQARADRSNDPTGKRGSRRKSAPSCRSCARRSASCVVPAWASWRVGESSPRLHGRSLLSSGGGGNPGV